MAFFFQFNDCYGNKNGRQNSLEIEESPFWTKFKAFLDGFF